MKHIPFSPLFVRSCVGSLCLFFSLAVMAVPVERSRRLVKTTAGTELWVTPYGDETFSYLLADDGYVVEPSATDARLYVKTQQKHTDMLEVSQRVRRMSNSMRFVGDPTNAPLPCKGSPKVPVVLVNFTDSVFSVASTPDSVNAYFDLYCNGTRDGKLYQEHGSYGAVRDYFVQQSDSNFLPEFTIIGPVTLNHPESYYGTDSGSSKDTGYNNFFKDAVTEATKVYKGDWSDFDNKGKGQVDMVFLIFAGCGQANGGAATTLWPRESMASVTVNNIKFATSACCNENRGVRKGGKVVRCEPDGIGVMCHELNHAMGMPDFYDTRATKASFGMDLWSLMDYGCYASNGYQPCGFTAYEREFYGWRMMDTLTQSGFLTLTSLEKGGKAYKIFNDENANEYYVLENRQSEGWDMSAGYYGHGLQVTHVDYIPTRWTSNTVNNVTDHQCMTIIAANNRYIGTSVSSSLEEVKKTWAGNLYPFNNTETGACNDSLTAHSVPAATVFTASGYMHKDLNAIKENADKTVTLYFGNDYHTAVTALQAPSEPSQARVYNIQGQPVSISQMQPGHLYILNGKKILFTR